MRGIRFAASLAATALIAGCGERPGADTTNHLGAGIAEPAAPAPEPAAAANSAGPAAAAPAAPAATGKTIPARLVGVYDQSLEACATSSDARVTISPAEIRFHESIGAVRAVATTGRDTVSVEADYQGEGESWRSVRELSLSEGGGRLTISGDGTRLDRVRCPGAR
ncbi:MAG TPA: hypothetical protein VEA61_05960 [Allosphingosinicella sp.]|nr:hypothetical protein [Allosphingosinicella sp.]